MKLKQIIEKIIALIVSKRIPNIREQEHSVAPVTVAYEKEVISIQPVAVEDRSQQIIDLCEKYWEAHKNNCSGLLKNVANELGIKLVEPANNMVEQIQLSPWRLLADGIEADLEASRGNFVVAGLKDEPHGHVVIVVKRLNAEPLSHDKYPFGYWGMFGGVGAKYKTINWSWTKADLDKVTYSALDLV